MKISKLIAGFLFTGILLIPFQAYSNKEFPSSFSSIAEKAIPAIVFITALKNNNSISTDEDPQKSVSGSGFLISSDGYILTSGHVVKDAIKITIFYKEQEIRANLIDLNSEEDIAILKISGNNFPYLVLGDSSKAKLGDWVVSIGYPFSIGPFLTIGVLSSKNKNFQYEGSLKYFLFTDALINPGNSGGPILNLKNEVIGVCTAILLSKENHTGVGMAIPINSVKNNIQRFVRLKTK